MRIDIKHDAELAKRKGLPGRTIVATVWLIMGFVIAYFLTNWLFESELISPNFFYNQLFIPRTVDEGIIRVGLMATIVVAMQFFMLIGFAVASPTARARPGTPTPFAKDPDPYDVKFNN